MDQLHIDHYFPLRPKNILGIRKLKRVCNKTLISKANLRNAQNLKVKSNKSAGCPFGLTAKVKSEVT